MPSPSLPRLLGLLGCALVLMTSQCQGQADDEFDANIFMETFGYLDDTPGHQHRPDSITRGVREYQRFHGLNVTGRLDRKTIRMMKRPRCGVPDVIKPGQRPLQLRDNPMAPLAYNAPGYKWDDNDVSYKWVSFTNKMPRDDQRRAIINALRKWSDVTPLRFSQSTGDADMLLSFGRRDHGDGRQNAFDGRSGTLAHAFFPGGAGLAGDTHFDDDEPWTVNTAAGTNLEIVAAHEFGHALGLGHSSNPRALMAPVYTGYDPDYELHQDDINGVQSLYGRGSQATRTTRRPQTTRRPRTTRRPPTTRRPRTTRPPRTTAGPTNNCNKRFHAIVQNRDGRTLAFIGRDVYDVTRQGIQNQRRTRSMYPGAPSNPGAVVYDRYRDTLYFFKGRWFWRYRGSSRARGVRMPLPEPFRRVRAGLQFRGTIYLFRGRDFMRWAEGMTSHASGYPRSSDTYFRGMPSGITGIFTGYDNYVYAFRGKKYYRFDRNARLTTGFPRDLRPLWLNCPDATRETRRVSAQITPADYSFLSPQYFRVTNA